MGKFQRLVLVLLLSFVGAGCQTAAYGPRAAHATADGLSASTAKSASVFDSISRAMIRKASMTVEVSNPKKSAVEVESLTKNAGGFVERSTFSEEESVDFTLRVPQEECDRLLDAFGNLGTLKRRQLSAEDVTEQLVDNQARLDTLKASRDRLRLQLQVAAKVEDVLAIERELTRIQSEIESLEGRLKVLQNDVAFTQVSLTLERRVIYGPVTYIGKAMWWGIEKLFIVRE